jgi:preprotein translocase subunit SecB
LLPLEDTRALAARVAARVELRDIRLFGVTASIESLPDSGQPLTYEFEADVQIEQVGEPTALIVNGDYKVVVKEITDVESEPSDEAEESAENIANVSFQLAALFALEDMQDLADGFPEVELDAFAETTGRFALHPYAREFIADITGRMGLPQLHIGTLKIQLDQRNDG